MKKQGGGGGGESWKPAKPPARPFLHPLVDYLETWDIWVAGVCVNRFNQEQQWGEWDEKLARKRDSSGGQELWFKSSGKENPWRFSSKEKTWPNFCLRKDHSFQLLCQKDHMEASMETRESPWNAQSTMGSGGLKCWWRWEVVSLEICSEES